MLIKIRIFKVPSYASTFRVLKTILFCNMYALTTQTLFLICISHFSWENLMSISTWILDSPSLIYSTRFPLPQHHWSLCNTASHQNWTWIQHHVPTIVHLGPLHHVGKLCHSRVCSYTWILQSIGSSLPYTCIKQTPFQSLSPKYTMWSLWNTCLMYPQPTMNLEPTPCTTLIQLGVSNVMIDLGMPSCWVRLPLKVVLEASWTSASHQVYQPCVKVALVHLYLHYRDVLNTYASVLDFVIRW